ncbi:MAG: sulfatase-like hydrolase/transferase [Verrucomicrobiales bacterium]|nr:sulfatase-like hydrolase/transferase [Verrucomicrobiales bacterium]
MTQRIELFRCIIAAGFLTLPGTAQSESSPTTPNIVLIFLDDLGYADVGFNAELFGVETDVVTPNIDALATGGTIFKQAYVAHPFCGPSRMALLSGRMPHTFGGQKNLPDVAKNLEGYNERGLPETEIMMSTVLQDAGYYTGCIGKWHIGSSKPFHPNSRGFDEFYGFTGGGHHYYPSLTDKVEPKVNDYQFFLEKNGEDIMSPDGVYLTDTLTEEAINFMKTGIQKEEPFFLYLAYNAPHSPLHGKTEDLQYLYPDHEPATPGNGVNFQDYERRQNYVAMIYAVDRGMKSIVDTLNDPDGDGDSSDTVMDNTLIVFMSDNGGKIRQGASNAPLQDDKGSTLEGGIRVPMFMHWPDQVPGGHVFEHPVLSLDLYPTFAGLANADIPEGKTLDGKDIWNDLLNGQNPRGDEPVFWLRHHGVGNEVSIRQGNLKAYRKIFGAWRIYDLSADLTETTDLAGENLELLDYLLGKGYEWSQNLIDPQWHDTAAGKKNWEEKGMPNWKKTFSRR